MVVILDPLLLVALLVLALGEAALAVGLLVVRRSVYRHTKPSTGREQARALRATSEDYLTAHAHAPSDDDHHRCRFCDERF